ncbi:MAG: hypothetical protein Q8K30_00780 [Candidatus Gracilibacteria bacterium]|nr:hypothetical protein [Candidatus Gracilibacteria bacterium]
MKKTKINKALAFAGIVAISATSIGSTFAAVQIGTGSVSGTGAFDASIMWDETYTAGAASGSVSDIRVLARVLPTLSMEISTGTIDLGTLVANVASTGSLFIEVGTNAKSGLSITARSGSGGLTKTDDNSVQINNLFTDGVDESYTYTSTPNAVNDSNSVGFTASGMLSTEINSNLIENTVYTTNKPEATNGVNDIEFVVGATTTAETPAGNYEDTITFTVTGNF